MKSKLILILAIGMAALTTFLFYRYMQQAVPSQSASGNMVDVVVAKQPIKKYEQLTADKLEVLKFPETGKFSQMVSSPEQIVGLYAETNIAKGEPVLSNHVQKRKEETIFVSKKLTPGYRAVSVGVNYVQSVSNLIEPEDRVDVVVSTLTQVNQVKQAKTATVVSNVKVLAVGGVLTEPDSKDSRTKYEAVTLELKPEDALKVIHASEQGDIQLILNSRVLPNKGGK
ncbi:MAG TPA: Flp pilus assembly protein CpaB [Bacillales bacterium]|nr:Flp pilus assembly protein CpaB [Bacillales bacterium]